MFSSSTIGATARLGPDHDLRQHTDKTDSDEHQEHQVLHLVGDGEQHLHLGRHELVGPGDALLQHEEGQDNSLINVIKAGVTVAVHKDVELEGGVGGEGGAPLWLDVQVELVLLSPRRLQPVHPLSEDRVAVEEVRPGHVDWGVGLY